MIPTAPSKTAFAAAMYRAAHQELDEGRLFRDPYAMRILGSKPYQKRALDFAGPRPLMRFFIAVRSRLAEGKLGEAVARGTRQAVVLGAGLDTFALRNPHAGVTVFEVDHPATQAWKQLRLTEAGLDPGDTTRFVPVDFERENLAEELAAAGFDAAAPAFFLWLGVVPYLTKPAVFETLRFVASVRRSETVFDYANPLEQLAPEFRAAAKERARRVAEIGEAFVSYFDTAALHEWLRALGATDIDDFGPVRLAKIYGRDAPSDAGGHVVAVRFD